MLFYSLMQKRYAMIMWYETLDVVNDRSRYLHQCCSGCWNTSDRAAFWMLGLGIESWRLRMVIQGHRKYQNQPLLSLPEFLLEHLNTRRVSNEVLGKLQNISKTQGLTHTNSHKHKSGSPHCVVFRIHWCVLTHIPWVKISTFCLGDFWLPGPVTVCLRAFCLSLQRDSCLSH